ncbi:hypothetical protein NEF87_003503 [Candidatus Lokiarchaeum ossiferum]|uniref:Histidine kinase N-terminal 7TM region domain-containing protein n=1 Tax=Candidatus Lokiarchaeum ossiferum TaxID=2951803 RepID=A0ABY6HUL6_9ARCH|nr:hypothetical protein NEF87_003503 [Candidatus Lokiarchaeum sp. B-35]
MSLLQVIRTTFLVITTLIGVYSSVKIIQKNKTLMNYLMAAYTFLIGLYTFTVILYDFITELVYFLIPFGILALFLSTLSIYFSVQCMLKSQEWFDKKERWIPFLILWVAYAIILYSVDLVTIVSNDDVINTQVEMWPLLIGIVFIMFFLIFTLVNLFQASKAFETPNQKVQLFIYSVSINIVAVIVSVISQVVTDGGYIDLVFYMLISISALIMLKVFNSK